jgi:predicted nucleotidyltransferase
MEEEIHKILNELQTGNNPVRILFAIEGGSRAWRIDSKSSDYDVRFVYARRLEDYLKLDRPADVIQRIEGDVDAVGFDIYKFCRLLKASNPSAIEWLTSDIVYLNEQPPELVDFAQNHFNPKALFWHYKSMCKSNYLKYIKSREGVTYKRYLYAMRGLVNALYVLKEQCIPPIAFPETLMLMKNSLPPNVYKTLTDIIEFKKQSKEKDIVKNVVQIDDYIESQLKQEDEPVGIKKPLPIGILSDFCIKEVTKGLEIYA